MNQERIQSALKDALGEEFPASQIDLWPAVKANLVAGKLQPGQQGEKMNTTQTQRLPRFAFALVIIAALLVIALLTPQGRTFAQNVLQLFTRVTDTTTPVQDSQMAAVEIPSSAPTAMPPSPLISVAEASAKAGFPAAVLHATPQGLEYLGARMYGETINIEYQTPDKSGHLYLKQSQSGFLQSEWDQVPASAVTAVKIGDLEGELVQGIFVLYPGDTEGTWNQDGPFLRLRWEKDGIWYELNRHGYGEFAENLDQSALIALAENLVYQQ
jgi:hypothetical protein